MKQQSEHRFLATVENNSIKTGLRKIQGTQKTTRQQVEQIHDSPQHFKQLTAKQQQSLQSSGMVQSITTGSISGSIAGNQQSYSVSGSMKRENSNESGSIMRSQDLIRPYGTKQDHNDQSQQRSRFQSQEDNQDQRRIAVYNQKDFKNVSVVPTEYQVTYLNEYQSASENQRVSKSSRMSSQAAMTIPDEKAEYNQVLEVNQYLDDELGPPSDTALLLQEDQRQQYMYSAQEFNKDTSEKMRNHAHFQMEQRIRKTKTSLQTMNNTPHKQDNQQLQGVKTKSGNQAKMIFGQQKSKQVPNQMNKLYISNQSTSNLHAQNYGNIKIMPQSTLNKTQSQAMLLCNLQNGLDQSSRGSKQAYQHNLGQKNSENSLLFVPDNLRDLNQSQSQSSLNIIVNSPRIQSAVRHLRPGTTLANNGSYVPESLMPQHNFMTTKSHESVSVLSNPQKSTSKEHQRQQVPLTSKQQEMQRQHNLLKAKFAKYSLAKPKFQSTKSLSDLLQRNRSRGDTVDSTNKDRQSLPQPAVQTRHIKTKHPNSIMIQKNDKNLTQSSRNGDKQQLTAVSLQKTREENNLHGFKISEPTFEVISPKNIQLQQLTQRSQFDSLQKEQSQNYKVVFAKAPKCMPIDQQEQRVSQRTSKDNQMFLISPKGLLTATTTSDSRTAFDQNEEKIRKFAKTTIVPQIQPQQQQCLIQEKIQSNSQYGITQNASNHHKLIGKSPLSLDDTANLNITTSLDRTCERTLSQNQQQETNQFATSALSEISKHKQQKVNFQEAPRSISRGQQSKLLPKPQECTPKINYNQTQNTKQPLQVASVQFQTKQKLPQSQKNTQKQQNVSNNGKKRDLMFKRQSNESEKKPEQDQLQISLAHAADNYQTIQATHNLILQLSNRQTPQQTTAKFQLSAALKNVKTMPRTNSVTQINKPNYVQNSEHKKDDERSEDKRLQSNNSVNCLFGPKSHFIQESTPRPKLDKMVLDGSDQSVQTTKAFGPTNTILKAKGANLYQKVNFDENEDQAQTQIRPSSSFKSDFVDYQPETMGELHQAKSLEELTQLLREACTRGDLQFVKQLAQMQIELKAQISNSVNKEGWTPLHFAAYSGHAEILETLIRKLDANVDAQNKLGQTPLHLACKKSHKKVIERLLLARANTEIKDCLAGNTALHVLAASDKLSNPISNGSSVVGTQKSRADDNDMLKSVDNYSSDQNKTSTHSSDPNRRNIADKEVRQRAKLIDIMLPFTKNCKQMQNRNGNLPWQLAQNPLIVKLLMDSQVPQVVQSQPKVANSHFVMVAEKQQSEIDDVLQASSSREFCDKSNNNSTNQRSINEKSKSSGFQSNINQKEEKTSKHVSLQEETKAQRPVTGKDIRSANESAFKLIKTLKTPQKDEAMTSDSEVQFSIKHHFDEQSSYDNEKNKKSELQKIQKTPEISIRDTVKVESRILIKNNEKSEIQKKQELQLQMDKEALKETTKAQLKRFAQPKTNEKPRSQSRDISQVQFEDIVGPDNFIAHQLLGTGSFGEVFLVERKTDKQLLAMKVLSKKRVKQQNLRKYAMTERNVMGMMGRHPFIVELRYAFQTKEHLFLVSDYCPGGDLSQYLEIEGQFSEEKAKLFTQEILLAIEMLHEGNVIFRDLKPDNVIIDSQGHALLTDFGLSRENVRKSEFGAKSFCGSYAYLAPEMLKKQGHGKAVDWYLLGVILYEMVTGLPPYYADDKEELFANIIKNDLDLRNTGRELNLSSELIDVLQKLLEKDPSKRLGTKEGAAELKAHPFFKGTNWSKIMRREVSMPEAYLAKMAMDIIKQQPYLVAGHPHTIGEICQKDHPSYYPNWTYNYEQVKDAGEINRLYI